MTAQTRYFATVHGPHIEGPFGKSEGLIIESPTDVQQDERGNLVIRIAAQEAGFGGPRGQRYRARKARHVIYPRGEWYKVVVGEIEPRS